jgi:hypothetical protein
LRTSQSKKINAFCQPARLILTAQGEAEAMLRRNPGIRDPIKDSSVLQGPFPFVRANDSARPDELLIAATARETHLGAIAWRDAGLEAGTVPTGPTLSILIVYPALRRGDTSPSPWAGRISLAGWLLEIVKNSTVLIPYKRLRTIKPVEGMSGRGVVC